MDVPVLCEGHCLELRREKKLIVINPRFGWYLYVPAEKYQEIWREVLRKSKWASNDVKNDPLPGFVPPYGIVVCPQMYYMDILAKDLKEALGVEGDKELKSLQREYDELESEVQALQDDLGDVERKIERYPMEKSPVTYAKKASGN